MDISSAGYSLNDVTNATDSTPYTQSPPDISQVSDYPTITNHTSALTPSLLSFSYNEFPLDTNGIPMFSANLTNGSDYNQFECTFGVEEAIRNFLYHYKDPQVAVLIALYILSFLLGFVGNLLVIVIFTKHRKMRTVTNSFLVNLAVCDLLVVCLCMPISLAHESYHNWIYGNVVCKLVNFVQGLSISASIITLAVISAERFYAVNHPLQARAFMSKSRVVKIISSIWVASALTILPILIVRKEELVQTFFDLDIYVCKEEWNLVTKLLYNISLCVILYILPVVCICIGYLRIGISLWRTDSNLHAGSNQSRANRTLAGRRKVARMLFVMAILFTLSWLPFQIMSLAVDLLPVKMLENHGLLIRNVFSYAVWLGHTNSSINPICYCIMSESFKKAIQQEMTHCCRGTHQTYLNPSLSLTMSTSGAMSRSRISTNRVISRSGRSGYKLVANGTIRNDIALSAVVNGKVKGGEGLSLYNTQTHDQPDLLKHITTNI